eukprot:ctg_2325.g546
MAFVVPSAAVGKDAGVLRGSYSAAVWVDDLGRGRRRPALAHISRRPQRRAAPSVHPTGFAGGRGAREHEDGRVGQRRAVGSVRGSVRGVVPDARRRGRGAGVPPGHGGDGRGCSGGGCSTAGGRGWQSSEWRGVGCGLLDGGGGFGARAAEYPHLPGADTSIPEGAICGGCGRFGSSDAGAERAVGGRWARAGEFGGVVGAASHRLVGRCRLVLCGADRYLFQGGVLFRARGSVGIDHSDATAGGRAFRGPVAHRRRASSGDGCCRGGAVVWRVRRAQVRAGGAG